MHPSWEVFEALCEEHGIKPARVFRNIGLSPSNATHWKQGVCYPKIDKIKKIAECFGKEIDDFYV